MVWTHLAPYPDYNTEIDLDEIIRRFARLHPRRILGTGQYPVYMTQKPRKLKKVFQIFLGLFTLSLSWLSYCRGGSILSLLEIPLTRLVNKS